MAMAELGYVTGLFQSRVWSVHRYLTDYEFLMNGNCLCFCLGVHYSHLTFLFVFPCPTHVCPRKQGAFRLLARSGSI